MSLCDEHPVVFPWGALGAVLTIVRGTPAPPFRTHMDPYGRLDPGTCSRITALASPEMAPGDDYVGSRPQSGNTTGPPTARSRPRSGVPRNQTWQAPRLCRRLIPTEGGELCNRALSLALPIPPTVDTTQNPQIEVLLCRAARWGARIGCASPASSRPCCYLPRRRRCSSWPQARGCYVLLQGLGLMGWDVSCSTSQALSV